MRPPSLWARRLWLGLCLLPLAAGAATLRLRLVDARDGRPVAGAAVQARDAGRDAGRDADRATTSDSQGEVVLRDLPMGNLRLSIRHVAYQPIEQELTVEAGDTPPRLLRLEPALHPLPELVVDAPSPTGGVRLELDPARPSSLREPAAILERLPGLSLQQTHEGGRLEARWRGARADQLAVRLDGVPLNPASGEAVDLSAIDWSRVRQVELRADGSRPGGELRLSTRPLDGRAHLRGIARAGDPGRRGLDVDAGGPAGVTAWHLSLDSRASDGDHLHRDEGGERRHRLDQEHGRLRGSVEVQGPAGGWRIHLHGRQESQGLPGPLHQPPTPDARQESWSLGGGLSLDLSPDRGKGLSPDLSPDRGKGLSPNLSPDRGKGLSPVQNPGPSTDRSPASTLALWFREDNAELDSPARQWHAPEGIWVTRVPFALRSRERQAGASLQAPWGPSRVEVRLFHHDYRQGDELRVDPLEGLARRWQLSGALDHGGALGRGPGRHQLGGGLEVLWDANGPRRRVHLLGHAQALLERPWHLGDLHAAAHVALSHSRQAPAFRPLFLAESATVLGNPHLRPERQSGARAGGRLAAPAWWGQPLLTAELWGRLYQDGIIWRRNFRNQYLPVNLSLSSAVGLDASLALRHGPWSLEGACTLQRLRNEDEGSPYHGRRLPFQPDGLGQLRLERSDAAGGFQLQLSARGRSFGSESNLDPQGIAGVGLPAWRRLDLRAWRQWRPGPVHLRLGGSLGNLLDEEMETVDGYPWTGRSWSVDLEVSR